MLETQDIKIKKMKALNRFDHIVLCHLEACPPCYKCVITHNLTKMKKKEKKIFIIRVYPSSQRN